MELHILALASLYYFLPAYFANMAPLLQKKFDFFKKPVDFKKKWRGKRIFGAHKTWGGLVIATLIGTLVFYFQQFLFRYSIFQKISLIDYSQQTILLGFLLGSGAIIGDLIKSFFKRRQNLEPGKSWMPFDQLDFVLGAFLLSFLIYIPPVFTIVLIILVSPLLHLLFNYLGYLLKLKETKW